MIKKIIGKIDKYRANCEPKYIAYCEKPLVEKLVLLEGGQGSNINGSMFAMLKELQTNPRWAEYTSVFVVTEDTEAKARARMEFYGFKNVVLSVRGSDSYLKYLATAKYIMTDNSFPPYFNKRDEQVFLNTWHGTPLKTLGKSNKSSLDSIANIQKNYLMSDYALFPNEFTRDVFMNDYDLRNIFSGKSLIANYPRNYIFYDPDAGAEMKKKLGFGNKSVFAYMPTWRDAADEKEKKAQLDETRKILSEFDKKLPEDTILLVNLHFLLASEINCDNFTNVKYFPVEYDTYEVLNACDGLITDYSSVFFDYAVTGKKVILYAYDKDEYLSTRGLYMPFESLPFPIVEDVDSVITEMKTETVVPKEFIEEFCPNGWRDSCERLFEMLVKGETDSYKLETNNLTEKKICLAYGGILPPAFFKEFAEYVRKNPEYDYVVAYRRNLTQDKKEKIDEFGCKVSVYGLLTAFQFKFWELISFFMCTIFGIAKGNKILHNFYKREAHRMFYSMKPEKVIDFSCNNSIVAGMLSNLSGEKMHTRLGDINYTQKIEKYNGFKELEEEIFSSEYNPDFGDFYKSPRFKNVLPLYFNAGKKIRCISRFSITTHDETNLLDSYMEIGEKQYKIKFFLCNKKKLCKKHKGFYSVSVPLSDLLTLPAKNEVAFVYKNSKQKNVKCNVSFLSPLRNIFLGLRGPIIKDKETDTVAVFRQERGNKLIVYVRSENVTDKIIHRIKQLIAYGVSVLWNTKKAKKIVLLYEKNSSKYEESASVLYEELIDKGYNNAYFIVTRDYEFIDRIPEKYQKNIIYKYSFKHYLYFFKTKTFIGTEAIAHAIDLKTFNILALKKVASKNINYVFLQHGVMYMVSLDSESRKMFKRKNLKGKYRVIVSSQAEADHFTTLGRHLPEDIYITGLPKFDRNQYNKNADKIVIMPTWRPWEINVARTDFKETPYFKMIMRIYDSVPENLKEKVLILPHPLIVNELSKLSDSITSKIILDARYDDVLKDTAVLITDYSSIAYDAFYRGARVVFYWEEKDYCMQSYGPTTKLMLNEENVYGDVAYSTDGLGSIIEKNYNNPQTEEQKEKYGKLVDFHDGKNTQRLIGLLKKDGII